MPTLTIDNQEVTVPDGTNVLEAAKRLGIVIPHFCYHEALGAVGACRLCAMKFVDGPVKGIQMSCMIPAQDGMVVSTVDPDAAELRSHVIEWLMMNHPHDCPVCDEGGECQLQDMTIAGGHGMRRYRGPKRTWINQDLGPVVVQEMNRCIQCYRCVRTYQDYCGGTDFGVMGSRNRLFFGRFKEGKLDSPFSGNIIDACPTGVFTSKPFRYKTRYWDIEEAPSVCPHCSLGCAVVPGGHYREALRVRSGINQQTNGFFICDRGRFGYDYHNHPERPREPRWQKEKSDWATAMDQSRERLARLAAEHGPESIAFLGSPRASLEANVLLAELAESLGSSQLVFNSDPRRDRAARTLAAGLGSRARSLEEIRQADCLVLIGSDPLNEAPALALAVRQAVRRGALAAVIDPRPVELPCEGAHLPLLPERFAAALQVLGGAEAEGFSRQQQTILAGLRERLKSAKKPILIGGADLLGAEGIQLLLETAAALEGQGKDPGVFVSLDGPNSYGGALLAGAGPDFDALLDGLERGTIKALVCLASDPLTDHPERFAAAQGNLQFLLTLDCLPTRTAQRADALLPTTGWAESDGCTVNNEGRMLSFSRAFVPGLPIRVTGRGNHPPRNFQPGTPGSLPCQDWAVLAELLEIPPRLEEIHRRIEERDPRFAGLSLISAEGVGVRIKGSGQLPPGSAGAAEPAPDKKAVQLLVVETLFGSELLASLSGPLLGVRAPDLLLVHPEQAKRLGLADGVRVRVSTDLENFTLTLATRDGMADGVAVTPRLFGTPTERFTPGSRMTCRIEAGEGP